MRRNPGGSGHKILDYAASGSIRATAYTQSRSRLVTPVETFEAAKDAQNVSDGVANPVTLRTLDLPTPEIITPLELFSEKFDE